MRQRINSWRGHIHGRIALGIAGAYNLGPSTTNTPEIIKARAIHLGDKEFHRSVSVLILRDYLVTHFHLACSRRKGELHSPLSFGSDLYGVLHWENRGRRPLEGQFQGCPAACNCICGRSGALCSHISVVYALIAL